MKKEHQKMYNDKVRTMEENIEELKSRAVKEAREIAFRNKSALEEKDKRYESMRVALES
mgnify:CR=1 FL=1